MMKKPGLLDGFTRIDEQLEYNTKVLSELTRLMQQKEDRELKIVFYSYPADGTYLTLSAGTLTIDFDSGTVNNNGTITYLDHSLQSDAKDFLRSLYIDTDKSIVVQVDYQDKIPVKEGKQLLGTYQQFKRVTITATVTTKLFLLACTNPEAIIQFVNYAMVFKDPDDVYGNPNYVGGGELAARLGSIKHYEKRGEVVFMDDFEGSTFKWIEGGTGTGNSVARSNDIARSGDFSIKMIAGDAVDNYSDIRIQLMLPTQSRLGFEFSFLMKTDIKYIEARLFLYTGTVRQTAYVRYDPQNNKLQYQDNALAWQDIATDVDVYEGSNVLFNTMKLVIDYDAIEYLRLFFNNTEYDLSDIAMYSTGSSIQYHLMWGIKVYNNKNGSNPYIYVDDFILTQNEP